MSERFDLSALTAAEVADLAERTALLEDWMTVLGGEIVVGGDGLLPPVRVLDVLGAVPTDRLDAGLRFALRFARLAALYTGLSPEPLLRGVDAQRSLDRLCELERVLFQEVAPRLARDSGREVAVEPAHPGEDRVGVALDLGHQAPREVGDPDVHHARELAAIDRDGIWTRDCFGHGRLLLDELRLALVSLPVTDPTRPGVAR